METTEIKITVLTATKDMWLTQSSDVKKSERIFSKEIYLSVTDTPDNWTEITDSEKQTLTKE